MDGNETIHCKLHVILAGQESFWGPGVARLLRLIQQDHSMRKASERMGISYSKGWKILKRAEKELRIPLLQRQTGGPEGGGSSLTEEAVVLIDEYDRLVESLNRSLEEQYPEYQNTIEQLRSRCKVC